MRILKRALALLLLAALLLPMLAGCTTVNRPLNYLKKALEKALERRLGSSFTDILGDALSEGSIALSFGGTNAMQTPVDALDAKLYFAPDRDELVATGSVTLEGETYDGKLWLDEDRAVLSSATLFGSVNFGVNFETLEKDLQNSVFRNNSGTAYANPEIDAGTAGAIRNWKDGLFDLLSSMEDYAGEYDDAVDVFLRFLAEHAPNTKYSEDGRYHIAVTIENHHLSRALRDTHAKLSSDRKFCREMRELAATRDAMETAKTGILTSAHTEKVNAWLSGSGELEALCTKIDNQTPFVLELRASVRRLNGVLESATVSYREQGVETFAIALDLTNPDALHATLLHKGVCTAVDYTVTTDKWRSYGAEMRFARLHVDGSAIAEWRGTLAVNKREKTFALSASSGAVSRVFTGSYQKKLSSFSVTVDGLSENGAAKRFALSLTVKAEDDAPECPDYTNLFAAGEDRIAAVAPRFTQTKARFLAAWERAAINKETPLQLLEALMGI